MYTETPLGLVLAGILLLSTVPSSAVARPAGPEPLVLTEYDRTDEIVVSGRTYVLYEYESRLPYVGGIAVYRDGEPIRERATVERVLTAYAHRTAVAGLRRDELRILRRLQARSRAVEAHVTPLIAEINETLAYTRTLENTTVDNRTAWKASTEHAPALDHLFRPAYRGGTSEMVALRGKLGRVRRTTTAIQKNASVVITLVQRRRNGTDINRTVLFQRYTAVLVNVERTTRLTAELADQLATTANKTETIATEASTVPEVGADIERRFTALTEQLRATATQFGAANEELPAGQTTLQKVDRRAASIRDRMLKRWAERGTIRAKVYGSIGEGVILALAGVLTTIRYRRM